MDPSDLALLTRLLTKHNLQKTIQTLDKELSTRSVDASPRSTRDSPKDTQEFDSLSMSRLLDASFSSIPPSTSTSTRSANPGEGLISDVLDCLFDFFESSDPDSESETFSLSGSDSEREREDDRIDAVEGGDVSLSEIEFSIGSSESTPKSGLEKVLLSHSHLPEVPGEISESPDTSMTDGIDIDPGIESDTGRDVELDLDVDVDLDHDDFKTPPSPSSVDRLHHMVDRLDAGPGPGPGPDGVLGEDDDLQDVLDLDRMILQSSEREDEGEGEFAKAEAEMRLHRKRISEEIESRLFSEDRSELLIPPPPRLVRRLQKTIVSVREGSAGAGGTGASPEGEDGEGHVSWVYEELEQDLTEDLNEWRDIDDVGYYIVPAIRGVDGIYEYVAEIPEYPDQNQGEPVGMPGTAATVEDEDSVLMELLGPDLEGLEEQLALEKQEEERQRRASRVPRLDLSSRGRGAKRKRSLSAGGSGGGGYDSDRDDEFTGSDEEFDSRPPSIPRYTVPPATGGEIDRRYFEFYENPRKRLPPKNRTFGCFYLPVIYETRKTGFEEGKEFPIRVNDVVAGRYQIVDVIGSAAFSRAVTCYDLEEQRPVCLKIIKNVKDFVDQSLDEIKLLNLLRLGTEAGDLHAEEPEARARRDAMLNKKHVVALLDYFYYQEHLFLVFELLKDNLYEFGKFQREAGRKYFSVPRLQVITKQLLVALHYLHSFGVIHCDMKPENILLVDEETAEIKLIDFGSSCFTHDNLCAYIQSRTYRAPEVILGLPFGQEIDIWSMGAIVYELFTDKVLFSNNSMPAMIAKIVGLCGPLDEEMLIKSRFADRFFTRDFQKIFRRCRTVDRISFLYPKRTSLRHLLSGVTDDLEFIDFLSRCFVVNPARRMTILEAFKHPWMTKVYPQNKGLVKVEVPSRRPARRRRSRGGGGGGGGRGRGRSGESRGTRGRRRRRRN